MGKKSRSGPGKNIPYHISQRLETIFWVKILKFFDANPDTGSGNLFDSGSGMEKIRIGDKHPGFVTLPARLGIFKGRCRDRVVTKQLPERGNNVRASAEVTV
jgi:hypothetical protein